MIEVLPDRVRELWECLVAELFYQWCRAFPWLLPDLNPWED